MPDSAFRATERQFVSLLESASDGIPVRLVLYALPGIRREGASRHHAESFYSSVETLGEIPLDGLIVTGREPVTTDLRTEAYWESFTGVLGWARENTHSTVWSCLAAHAAILHMDGIERRKSERKHFGVLECTREQGHPLLIGMPARFCVPHSRWNGVAAEELEDRGYTVLARSKSAGVDTFVKQDGSLFVFFQGHPEYEADTLLREYRRDARRYLRGESDSYPLIPAGYFNRTTADALNALREKAQTRKDEDLLERVSAVLEKPEIRNTWRRTATLIYRNWLEYICACEGERQMNRYDLLRLPLAHAARAVTSTELVRFNPEREADQSLPRQLEI
jgi:homoserine O-succinyltransferase